MGCVVSQEELQGGGTSPFIKPRHALLPGRKGTAKPLREEREEPNR